MTLWLPGKDIILEHSVHVPSGLATGTYEVSGFALCLISRLRLKCWLNATVSALDNKVVV